MEALRKSLVDSKQYSSKGIDLGLLIVEWNALSRSELKGWFLLQIMAGLNTNIIDVDYFLSLTLANVKTWDQFPLVGLALRCGANPNIYFRVHGLGSPHALVYAADKARANGLALDATDALCIMLIAMGSRTGGPAFSDYGSIPEKPKSVESSSNYDQSLVMLASMPQPQPSTENVKSRTVAQELDARAIKPLDDYMKILKEMGGYIPAIVGTCIDKKEIAYLIPDHIPEFEYLIACQASSLFESYPKITPAKHMYMISGEITGMRQAIEGGCYKAFLLFITSGVIPTYFIINRLCYFLSEAYLIQDKAYFAVLIAMLNLCIGTGVSLDTAQYEMLRVATVKGGSNNKLGDMTQFIQEVYKVPKWQRACKASPSAEVPSYLRQLAFNLGIDPNQNRESLCGDLSRLNTVDATKIRDAAIARQKSRISNTVATVSDFVNMSGSNPVTSCANSQGGGIIPEDYNDVLMSFYKDNEGKVYCFTSVSYEDIITTKQEPINGKPLAPEYIEQLRTKLNIIRQLGLNPQNPTPVYQAAAKLREQETFPPVNDDFATNTIIKTLQTEQLAPVTISNATPDEMNSILQPIHMYQDLLPKLQPSHQITTFYEAAYYALRLNPSEVKIFLDSYRTKGNLVLRPETVTPIILPTAPSQPFITYPTTFTTLSATENKTFVMPTITPLTDSQPSVSTTTVSTVSQPATLSTEAATASPVVVSTVSPVISVPTPIVSKVEPIYYPERKDTPPMYYPQPKEYAAPGGFYSQTPAGVYPPGSIPVGYQMPTTLYPPGPPSSIVLTSQEDPRLVALERDYLARKSQIEHENIMQGYIAYSSVTSSQPR